jgi:hypothetical protein
LTSLFYAQGDPGPPNELSIGAVVEGDTADADLTGESPTQVLSLVLPRGNDGLPGVGIVGHGTDADYPRPDTEDPVLWVGSVVPNNALSIDAVIYTAGVVPNITTTELGTITHGVALTPVLLEADGTTPLEWEVVSGLPSGLHLTAAGILWGTAASAGSYHLTVSVTNGFGTDEYEYIGTIA